MDENMISLLYQKFDESAWYEQWSKDFLKMIVPKNMYDFIYPKDYPYSDGLWFFMKSILKMSGYSKKGLIHFDSFSIDGNCFRRDATIKMHNERYRIDAVSKCCGNDTFNELKMMFYRNLDDSLFLTLDTYYHRDAWSDFLHKPYVKALIDDCYETGDEESIYSVGAKVGLPIKLGYYMICTGNAYWLPFRHTKYLLPEEHLFDVLKKRDELECKF
jgi:hypothetical protein